MKAASREYTGEDIDMNKVADAAESFFRNEKYEVQRANHPKGVVIQARKKGILRDLLAEDRAFTVMVTGGPKEVKVSLGVGKWLQNLGVAVIEGIILTPLLWLVEIPLGLWSFEIENQFWSYMEQQIQVGLSPEGMPGKREEVGSATT